MGAPFVVGLGHTSLRARAREDDPVHRVEFLLRRLASWHLVLDQLALDNALLTEEGLGTCNVHEQPDRAPVQKR